MHINFNDCMNDIKFVHSVISTYIHGSGRVVFRSFIYREKWYLDAGFPEGLATPLYSSIIFDTNHSGTDKSMTCSSEEQ